jgi:predicted ATPase/class 3 adenylate cyclase
MEGVRELPMGTVTLLFTDIEGSTRLLHELGERYADVLAEHRRVLRGALQRHGGVEVDTQGDAFFYAFAEATAALTAAAEAQEALAAGPTRVRIGVHTGEPIATAEGYVGIDIHRAARIMSAGHGGQVLVSESTRAALEPSNNLLLVDLGLHRLKDLEEPEKLYQLGDAEFPPLDTLDATNLPVAASPLLGRERELGELLALLRDGTRLVTVTGPGGTGKTRLALQVAAELVGLYPDGVFWVPLAALREPALVLPQVAQTVGARGELVEHLEGKELLLLVDNAEHLLPAAARPLGQLLAGDEGLRMLVTSRAPLHLSGEREYPLEPLRVSDAVTLFCERARAAGRELVPDETIAAICQRLDGLPLAVELAASRTKLLDPVALLARLQHALPLLTGGPRDVPARQQTLLATIDWSYELLDDEAKRLLARLSVFAGTFEVVAAELICEADLDLLAALVDFSLVKSLPNSRLFMLETIREYALDRSQDSGETAWLRDRHSDYYLRLAGQAMPALQAIDAGAAIDRLAEELPNLRLAFSRAAATDPERALRVAVGLRRFWNARAPEEALSLLKSLYRPESEPRLRLAALGDLAFFAMDSEDWPTAERCASEQQALARSVGDARAMCEAVPVPLVLARRKDDIAAADRLAAEGVELAEELGRPDLVGKIHWYHGFAELEYGDAAAGLPRFERSLEVYTSAANDHGVAWARFGIADSRCRLGQWQEARTPLVEAAREFHSMGEWKALANCLDHVAAVAAVAHDWSGAARLRGTGDALWAQLGVPLESAYRPPHIEEALHSARDALGESFERERERGAQTSLDDVVNSLVRDRPARASDAEASVH